MKEKRSFAIGIILGGIAGWTLGFLGLPFIEENFSFWMGFISCLAFVFLGLMALFIWNKNALLLKWIGKTPTTKDPKPITRAYLLIWLIVSAFMVIGASVSSFLIFKQNEFYKTQTQGQNEKIAQQSLLLESSRKSNLIVLMNTLFDKMDEELKNNPKRILSDEMIARIAALNYSFKPYKYLEGDHLSEKKLSPERGQLLLVLSTLNIDSSSFNKIKRQVSFLGADLQGTHLSGMDLSGIDLREANLRDAELSGANLRGADLSKAYLWGSTLREADFRKAKLENTDLSWADMMGAQLKEADLNGAKIISAKLTKADLSHATMTWANLEGAFLNGANLTGIDMTWTSLKGANLSEAILKDAVMRVTNLIDATFEKADLEGVDFTGSIVIEENWLDKLDNWQVKGARQIQEAFDIVIDKSGLYDFRIGKAAQ